MTDKEAKLQQTERDNTGHADADSAIRQRTTVNKNHPSEPGNLTGVSSPRGIPLTTQNVLHLQRAIGHQASVRLLRSLKIGRPDDPDEREADRVAEQVMATPAGDTSSRRAGPHEVFHANRQIKAASSPELWNRRDTTLEKEETSERVDEEEAIQAKEKQAATAAVSPTLESQTSSMRGGGEPLPDSSLRFFEARLGQDLSQVRVHKDARAADSARRINARAYTIGQNIAFAAGQFAPKSQEGKKLLAHELTHVVQQSSDAQTQPTDSDDSNIDTLRDLLEDDEVEAAIGLMGRLTADEVLTVLTSRGLKELAIDAFDNNDMYRAVLAMGGDLYYGLQWMFDEGTDWDKVRHVLGQTSTGKERIRSDTWMRNQFVDICDNEEMAEAVDLLGGTLHQKLSWMKEEGSSWSLIKAKLKATPDPAERTALYNSTSMRDFFVSECDNEEMAEAVELLGGALVQKLRWMLAEGTAAELVYSAIRRSPAAEMAPVAKDKNVMNGLRAQLSKTEFRTVEEMLTQDLLQKGTISRETDTGNEYAQWIRHTRGEITISKEVKFVEKGTFAAGAFAALKARFAAAVSKYLSRKYQIKIEPSAGAMALEIDGVYPIVVKVVENPAANYPINLIGGQHGRSSVNEDKGTFYELGQSTEVRIPDIGLAHEGAHAILGVSDEYANASVPGRTIHTDHSLMGNFYSEGIAAASIKARHFRYLVDYVASYLPDRKISIVP